MSADQKRYLLHFCVAAFAIDCSAGMFGVARPYIAMNLGAESLQLGLLAGLSSVAYVLACPFSGMLSDRLNRKALVALSSLGVACSVALFGFAGALWQLYAIGIAWSVFLSAFWPSFFSWLGHSTPPGRLGHATTTVSVSWSAGIAVGSIVAGVLFNFHPILPFLAASIPALLAGTIMIMVAQPGRPETSPKSSESGRTRWRLLAASWLGNAAVTCMVGVMTSVFPKLGLEIGIDAALFGAFAALMGISRTLIFITGLRMGSFLRDWRVGLTTQAIAIACVASLAGLEARWWVGCVFAVIGVSLAANYYRSLYVSLEGGASSGLKSSLHEASLIGGVVLGSVGGGLLADLWTLRAPYPVLGAFGLCLMLVQCYLVLSARSRSATEPPHGEKK